jgi:hypothetical protein
LLLPQYRVRAHDDCRRHRRAEVATIGLIRMSVRRSEEPEPFAAVFRDNAAVRQTNPDGILQAPVLIGVEFSMSGFGPAFVVFADW